MRLLRGTSAPHFEGDAEVSELIIAYGGKTDRYLPPLHHVAVNLVRFDLFQPPSSNRLARNGNLSWGNFGEGKDGARLLHCENRGNVGRCHESLSDPRGGGHAQRLGPQADGTFVHRRDRSPYLRHEPTAFPTSDSPEPSQQSVQSKTCSNGPGIRPLRHLVPGPPKSRAPFGAGRANGGVAA